MKYTFELDSPDMQELLFGARSHLISISGARNASRFDLGPGHPTTVEFGRRVKAAERAVEALMYAIDRATPDRAEASTDTAPRSLPVGEEMPFVYGKPRGTASDPTPTRVKAAMQRRRQARAKP